MALTKQSFGLLVTTMTHWWSPTTIRISGDASVAGQISKTSDGRVEFSFPERLVMIANHQVRSHLFLNLGYLKASFHKICKSTGVIEGRRGERGIIPD